MLSLRELARLANENTEALEASVAPFSIAGRSFDTDVEPILMGVVNLSRDSTYRESIAPTRADAVRRALTLQAQGAHVIDVGAESSRSGADRVTEREQITSLVPLVEELSANGVPVSVESYELEVVRECVKAGAAVVNLTGTKDAEAIYEIVGEHDASLVMCFTPGETVRDELQVRIHRDPVPPLVEHFAPRIQQASERGVRSIAIDPGLGFFYGSGVGPIRKAQHQAQVLLHSFRLRELGRPICQVMPHAFDIFQEEFRTAEGVFTVLGGLGGVGIYRVHEVARVSATLRMMRTVGVELPEVDD